MSAELGQASTYRDKSSSPIEARFGAITLAWASDEKVARRRAGCARAPHGAAESGTRVTATFGLAGFQT